MQVLDASDARVLDFFFFSSQKRPFSSHFFGVSSDLGDFSKVLKASYQKPRFGESRCFSFRVAYIEDFSKKASKVK